MKKRLQCFIVSCLMFILLSMNVFAEGYIGTVTFALDQTTSAPLYSFAVVRRSYGDLISAGATGYLTNDVIRSAILNAKTSVGSGGVFNSGNPWDQNLFGSQVFIPSVLGSDVYGMYKSSSMEEEYLFRNGSGTLRSSAGNNLKYGTHAGYTATQVSEVESCFNEFATNWAATDTSGARKYDAVSFETYYHGDTHITTVETIAYHYVLHLSGYDDFGISWNSELGSTGYTYAQFGEVATLIAWDYHRPGMNAYAGFCQSLNSDKSDWYYAIETYYYNGIYKATLTPSTPGTIYAMTPATALSGINDRAGFNEPSDWAIMKGNGKYLDDGATLNDYVTTFRNHTLNATDNKSVPMISSTGTYTKRDFYYDMIIGGLGNNFCSRDKFVGRDGNPLISSLGTNDGVGTGCTLWIDCNNGKLPGQALDVPSDIPNFNTDESQAWGIKFEPSPQHGQITSDNKQPISGYLKIVDVNNAFGLNSYVNRIANSSYGYFVIDVTLSDPTADSTNLSPTCTYGINDSDTGTDDTTKHIRKVFDMSSTEDRATAQYYLMGGKMFYLYGNNDGIPNVSNGSMLAIDADVTFGFSVNANPADLTEFKDYWTTGTEPAKGAAKWYSSNPAGNDWLDDPVRNGRIGGGKNLNPNSPSWLVDTQSYSDGSSIYDFYISSGEQIDCYAAIKDSNGWDQDWDTLAGIPTTATVSAVFGAPLAVYDIYGNFESQKVERYVLVSTVVQGVEALYTLELEAPYLNNSSVDILGRANTQTGFYVPQDDPQFKFIANWPKEVRYTNETKDGEFDPNNFAWYQQDLDSTKTTGQYVLTSPSSMPFAGKTGSGFYVFTVQEKYEVDFDITDKSGYCTLSSQEYTVTAGNTKIKLVWSGTETKWTTRSKSCDCEKGDPGGDNPSTPDVVESDWGSTPDKGCGSDNCGCSPSDPGTPASNYNGTSWNTTAPVGSTSAACSCGSDCTTSTENTVYYYANPGKVTLSWTCYELWSFDGNSWSVQRWRSALTKSGESNISASFRTANTVTVHNIGSANADGTINFTGKYTGTPSASLVTGFQSPDVTNSPAWNGEGILLPEIKGYVTPNHSQLSTCIDWSKSDNMNCLDIVPVNTMENNLFAAVTDNTKASKFYPFDEAKTGGNNNFYGPGGTPVTTHFNGTGSYIAPGFTEDDVKNGSCYGGNNPTVKSGQYLSLIANPAQPTKSHHMNLMKTYTIKCSFDSITYADVCAYTVYTPYLCTLAGFDDNFYDMSESGINYETDYAYASTIASGVMVYDVKSRPDNNFGNWFSNNTNLDYLTGSYLNANKSLLTGAVYYYHPEYKRYTGGLGKALSSAGGSIFDGTIYNYFVELDNKCHGDNKPGGYYTGSGRVLFSTIDTDAILTAAVGKNHTDESLLTSYFAGSALTGVLQYEEYQTVSTPSGAKFGGAPLSVVRMGNGGYGIPDASFKAPGLVPEDDDVGRYIEGVQTNFGVYTNYADHPMGHATVGLGGYVGLTDESAFNHGDLTGYANGYTKTCQIPEAGDCHLFFTCRWKNTGAPWVAPAADFALATAEVIKNDTKLTVISDYIDVRNETANWADLPLFGYTNVYTANYNSSTYGAKIPYGASGTASSLVEFDTSKSWRVLSDSGVAYITDYMSPEYTILLEFSLSPSGAEPSNASLEHGIMELTTQDMIVSDYIAKYDGGMLPYKNLNYNGDPNHNLLCGTFWGLGTTAFHTNGSERYYTIGFNGQWGGNGSFLYDRSVANWEPFKHGGPGIDMCLNQLLNCNMANNNLAWGQYFGNTTDVNWCGPGGIGTGFAMQWLYSYGYNSDNTIAYTTTRNTGYGYAMTVHGSNPDPYTNNIMDQTITNYSAKWQGMHLDDLAEQWWAPLSELSVDGNTTWLYFLPVLSHSWNPSGAIYMSSIGAFESLRYEDMDFAHTGLNLNVYMPFKVCSTVEVGFGNDFKRLQHGQAYYSIGDYVDSLNWICVNDDSLGGSPTHPVGLYSWIRDNRNDQVYAINATIAHNVFGSNYQDQGWHNTTSDYAYRPGHYGGSSDATATLGAAGQLRIVPSGFATVGIDSSKIKTFGYATVNMTADGYLSEIGPFNINDDAGNGLWSKTAVPYVSFILTAGNSHGASELETIRNTAAPSLGELVSSSNGTNIESLKETITVRCQYKENLGDVVLPSADSTINDVVVHNPVSTEYCYVFDADTVDNDAVDQRTVGNVNATDRQWVNIGGICGVWWSDFGNFYDDRYTARTSSPTKYRGMGTVNSEGWNWATGTDLSTLRMREMLLVDGTKDCFHLIQDGHWADTGHISWIPGLWLTRSSDGFFHKYRISGGGFAISNILPDHISDDYDDAYNDQEHVLYARQGYMYNMDDSKTYEIKYLQEVPHDDNAKFTNFIGLVNPSGTKIPWAGNYPVVRSEYTLTPSYFTTFKCDPLSDDAPAIIDGEVYADPKWGGEAKNYPLGNSFQGFTGAQYYLTQLYGNTGYMDYMNCEEFVGERYIVFPYPVGWYDAEGNWNVTGKGEMVDVNKLLFNSAGEKVTEMQDYRTAVVNINGEDVRLADREPLALEHPDNNIPGATMVSDMQPGYFLEFYILTSAEEAQDARVEFISIAKNAPDNSSGAVDMELTNAMPNNGDRSDVSYAALHCAKSLFYVDVVGRIGNPAIEDFGDFRFSNLFKQPTSEWLIPGVIHKIDIERPNMMISVPHDIFMKDVTDFTAHHASLSMTAWVLDAHFDGEKLVGKSGEFKTLPLTPSDNNVQDYKYTIPRIGYDIYMDIETVGNYYGVNSTSIDSGSWKDDDESKKYKMTIKPYWYLLDLDTSEFVPVDFWYGEEGSRVRCYEFGSDNRDYMDCNYQLEVDLPTEYMRRDISGAEYNLNTGTNAAGQNVFDIWNGTLSDGVAITNPSHVNPLETGPDYIGSASQIYLDEWDRLYIGSPVMYGTLNVDGGSSHYTDIKAYLGKDYESTGVANPDIVDLRGDGSKPNPSNPDPHVSDIIWNRWLGGMLFNQLMGYSSKDPADSPANGGNGMSYVNAGINGASYLNRLSNFAFYEQSQRWYYTIGLPSSALAVPHSSIIDQRQFTTVHEQMEADHPRYTFVCALTYEVKGEPWTLAYDWESSGLMEEDALGKYIPIRVFDLVDPTTGDPLYEYKFREGGGGSTITDRLIPVIVCGGEPGTVDGRDPVTGEDIHSDGGGGNSPEDLDIYGTH